MAPVGISVCALKAPQSNGIDMPPKHLPGPPKAGLVSCLRTQHSTYLREPRLRLTLCLAQGGSQGPGTQAGHKHKRFLSPGNLHLQIKVRWCLLGIYPHADLGEPTSEGQQPLFGVLSLGCTYPRRKGPGTVTDHCWSPQKVKISWSVMGKHD